MPGTHQSKVASDLPIATTAPLSPPHIYTTSRRRALLEDLGWAKRSPAPSPSPTRCENKALSEVIVPDLLEQGTKLQDKGRLDKGRLDKGRACAQRRAIQSSPAPHNHHNQSPTTPNNMRTKSTVMSLTTPHSPEKDAMYQSLAGLGPFSHAIPQYGKRNHDKHDETTCNPRNEDCKLYCRTLRNTEDIDGLFPDSTECNEILENIKQLLAKGYSEVAAFRQVRKEFGLPDVFLSKYGSVDLCEPFAIRLVARKRIRQACHVVLPTWRLNKPSVSELAKMQTDAQASSHGRLRRSSIDELNRLERHALDFAEASDPGSNDSSLDSPPPRTSITIPKRVSPGSRVDSAVTGTEAKNSSSKGDRAPQSRMKSALGSAGHLGEGVAQAMPAKRKRSAVDSMSPTAKKARTVSARVPQSQVEIVVTKITLRCTPKVFTKDCLVSAQKSSPHKTKPNVSKASADIEPKVTVTKEKEIHDIERAARENVLAGKKIERASRRIKTPARLQG